MLFINEGRLHVGGSLSTEIVSSYGIIKPRYPSSISFSQQVSRALPTLPQGEQNYLSEHSPTGVSLALFNSGTSRATFVFDCMGVHVECMELRHSSSTHGYSSLTVGPMSWGEQDLIEMGGVFRRALTAIALLRYVLALSGLSEKELRSMCNSSWTERVVFYNEKVLITSSCRGYTAYPLSQAYPDYPVCLQIIRKDVSQGTAVLGTPITMGSLPATEVVLSLLEKNDRLSRSLVERMTGC